eukprot:1954010-Rhodomonas_salina.1
MCRVNGHVSVVAHGVSSATNAHICHTTSGLPGDLRLIGHVFLGDWSRVIGSTCRWSRTVCRQ